MTHEGEPGRRVRLVAFRVCDICKREPAGEHSIVHNGMAVQLDLCAEHAKPLEELLDQYALASTKAPGYSTSPYRCEICQRVLSRRVHAAQHVQRQHGYPAEQSYAHIRPVGVRVTQPANSPAHRPHQCAICERPYVNASTAKRHVQQIHPDGIRPGGHAADYVTLIEEG